MIFGTLKHSADRRTDAITSPGHGLSWSGEPPLWALTLQGHGSLIEVLFGWRGEDESVLEDGGCALAVI